MYTETVKQLVAQMPNAGELADATHSAEGENPVCGDVTRLQLRVEGNWVAEIRFRASGCAPAIAAAAAATILCRGKSVDECRQISASEIADFLGGLPSHKLHGAELAANVLASALRGAKSGS